MTFSYQEMETTIDTSTKQVKSNAEVELWRMGVSRGMLARSCRMAPETIGRALSPETVGTVTFANAIRVRVMAERALRERGHDFDMTPFWDELDQAVKLEAAA